MHKGFQEEIEFTDKRKKALKKLVSLDEWEELEQMVGEILQCQAFNLISGSISKEEKMDDLEDAEGGYRLWRRIKELINKANE